MTDINSESILEALGLQRRSSADRVAPVAGALILGGLIGAGIALLFAPKSGEELRRELGQRIDDALGREEDLVSEGKTERELHPQRTVAPTERPLGT
jgi:hypothetical protein